MIISQRPEIKVFEETLSKYIYTFILALINLEKNLPESQQLVYLEISWSLISIAGYYKDTQR